ncbi:MAG TPA: hypothetical protein EYG91_06735 [Aquifex aeolicus]|nr:hypothetical protein [Aquifex aeolicus]
MKKILYPEEIEVIEKILAKGFEIENVNLDYRITVLLSRNTPLAKDREIVETVYAELVLDRKKKIFETYYVEYTKELVFLDGRTRTLETKEFSNFKELFEELERKKVVAFRNLESVKEFLKELCQQK